MYKEIVRVANQFNEIEAAKGKVKELVIHKYKDDKLFLETLDFAFNPFIVTGLAKKKMQKDLPRVTNTINSLEELFDFIKINNTGSDEVIQIVKSFISVQYRETHEFLTKLVTKDITIGVSAKTINKVIPGLIPEYKVQHAKRWDENHHKIKGPFAITLKEDGVRCTLFNLFDSCKAYSRQGKEFEHLVDIIEQAKFLPKGFIFDGELVADVEDKSMHSKDKFRATTKITGSKGIKKGLKFVVFDMVPYSEYLKGKSSRKWLDRKVSLNNVIDTESMPNFEVVKVLDITDDKSAVEKYFDEVIANGCEGLVMCDTEAFYQTKRVDSIQKLKPDFDADLRIVGYKEHKHGDRLGAIVVDYKGYEVSVGSGLDEKLGLELWKKRDELIGKIAEVQYLNESRNEKGGLSLRHPVFIRIRDDKDEPSYD